MGGHVLLRCIHGALLIVFMQSFSLFAFKLGIENSSDFNYCLLLSQKKPFSIGLISNQTARNQTRQRTVDVLREKGVVISYLLAPEHGFDGKALAGNLVGNGKDEKTSIPIVSVYGAGGDHTISGKSVSPDILKAVDAIVYDIQDSGMRHYTYISTMLCALESCAEYKKPLYVFDRPNFLGFNMEGPLVDSDLKSFISIASIPLRHGMTVGELARYFNQHLLKVPATLYVIPMQGYTRVMRAPFLAELSPNLLSEQSLYGYSFLGLLGEIRPFYVGVGTPLAFQVVMLPESKQFEKSEWNELVKLFAEYDIRAYKDRVARNNIWYEGVRLLFPEKAPFASFELFLKLVSFFRKRNVVLSFSPVFDKAIGTKKIKEWFKKSYSLAKLISESRAQLQEFHKKAQSCFLYEPHPMIKT